MPMLYAGKTFDDVPFVSDLDWLSSFLIVASTFHNQQNLTTRMHVPIQLCARVEGCYRNREIERTIAGI